MVVSSQEEIWFDDLELFGGGANGAGVQPEKESKGGLLGRSLPCNGVESGDHLARCMVYIDTNMVRAGVVSHPAMWPFCGYNEIQGPRRKNVLINYEKLQRLLGAASYKQLKSSHKGWIDEYLGDGLQARQDEWTRSIAVGSRPFIEKVKNILGFRAKGREVIEGFEGYQLRERSAGYEAFFGVQKDYIGLENTYRWDINTV